MDTAVRIVAVTVGQVPSAITVLFCNPFPSTSDIHVSGHHRALPLLLHHLATAPHATTTHRTPRTPRATCTATLVNMVDIDCPFCRQ